MKKTGFIGLASMVALGALEHGLDPDIKDLIFGKPKPESYLPEISEADMEEYYKILRKESKLSAMQREKLKKTIEKHLSK